MLQTRELYAARADDARLDSNRVILRCQRQRFLGWEASSECQKFHFFQLVRRRRSVNFNLRMILPFSTSSAMCESQRGRNLPRGLGYVLSDKD